MFPPLTERRWHRHAAGAVPPGGLQPLRAADTGTETAGCGRYRNLAANITEADTLREVSRIS